MKAMKKDNKLVGVVTGAQRGLGLEVSRQLAMADVRVILTGIDLDIVEIVSMDLQKQGLDVVPFPLDVTKDSQVQELSEFIISEFGRLDILINNAGVILDPVPTRIDEGRPEDIEAASVFKMSIADMQHAMNINAYGALRTCQKLVPLMNGWGRIVNVNSLRGLFKGMRGGWAIYRVSKVAMNAFTIIMADELKETNIKVNSVSPGWVRTEMGGAEAERSVEDGAKEVVWAALLPDDGPTGQFIRDREIIPW